MASSLENTTPLLETIPNIPNSWAVPNIPLRQDFVDYMNFEAVKPTIEDSNAVCLNYTGLIVAIVVFLIVQIILVSKFTKLLTKYSVEIMEFYSHSIEKNSWKQHVVWFSTKCVGFTKFLLSWNIFVKAKSFYIVYELTSRNFF